MKKILTLGEGWEKPETHDVVTVHYVGTLASDGSKVRQQPGNSEQL